MDTTINTNCQTTVAARVAGEDINQGDFVATLNQIFEFPSYLWSCSGATLPVDEPVRIRFASCDAGHPYKVVAVCLPFVYGKGPFGGITVIDTRHQQLVRLDPDRSREVWKHMRKTLKKKSK